MTLLDRLRQALADRDELSPADAAHDEYLHMLAAPDGDDGDPDLLDDQDDDLHEEHDHDH